MLRGRKAAMELQLERRAPRRSRVEGVILECSTSHDDSQQVIQTNNCSRATMRPDCPHAPLAERGRPKAAPIEGAHLSDKQLEC